MIMGFPAKRNSVREITRLVNSGTDGNSKGNLAFRNASYDCDRSILNCVDGARYYVTK